LLAPLVSQFTASFIASCPIRWIPLCQPFRPNPVYESKPLDHDANGEDVVCEEAGLAVVVVVAVPAVPDAAGFTAEAAWLVN